MSFTSNTTCVILKSCGLSDNCVYPILNKIRVWEQTKGTEWTINRLKLLKQAYIYHRNGENYFHDFKSSDLWIAHKDGVPQGVFKPIFKVKKTQKAISALMVYTSQISKQLTQQQYDKFISAVEDPPSVKKDDQLYQDISSSLNPFVVVQDEGFTPIENFLQSDKKTSYFDDDMNIPESKTISWSPEVVSQSLGQNHLYQFVEKEITCDESNDNLTPLTKSVIHNGVMGYNYTDQTDSVGVIRFIQEPGYKLRAVAIPHAGNQYCLSRLGNNLYSTLRNISPDATYNQEGAVKDIQQHMKKHGVIGSLSGLDLSSASDRIPLDLTNQILSENFPKMKEDIKLFEHVSKGGFELPKGTRDNNNVTNWKVGQPLGSYPSFAAMALTHHCIVQRSISKTLDSYEDLDKESKQCLSFYKILGDDVVVHYAVAPQLRKDYQKLGIPVNHSKSTNFSHMVEFAGRLITKDKTFVQPKWSKVSDRSFIDLARNLGPTVKPLLRPRQRAVVKLFSEVPKDLHPYGMGWNPKGKTYVQRQEESISLLDKLQEPVSVQSSIQSESLEALNKCYTYLHGNLLDQALSYDMPGVEKSTSQIERLESVILKSAGILTRIPSDNKIPGFMMFSQKRTSDPRGLSALQLIERVYKPDLKTRHQTKTKASNHSRSGGRSR